jgi:4-amino-4-deoxy-L-arabinose transferase-like glycosyltransferase
MLPHMSYSWETHSPASPTASAAPVTIVAGNAWSLRAGARARALAKRAPRPELVGLVALASVLNLWALSRNGWANEYYSAAVRSMSSSWHDFLYASLDHTGVMTVDKPPLALWVQALSVRVFGFHSLSILVPQALMGVASVALVYDLVRRRFGRLAGFAGGLALALTPITVAVSRHNNPDALLVLCCVAALWCAVRALEDSRTRWLVASGACVGLGFETKMGVALTVVPGIAAAWLWVAPSARGRLHALRQLLAGGAAMVLVGGAWPALVELTPAADRPWVSGTADNSILSLIFEYNGLGRVDGQTGGAGGGGGSLFGGTPGPLRLVGEALGGQAGWLLGFAVVAGLGILAASRLRRADARTGWLVVVGGAFLTTAVLFSSVSGIFHPYYVSLLAPFVAALVGAGAATLIGGGLQRRVLGPLAVVAGVAVELAIRHQYPGQLPWLGPVLIVVGVVAVLALAASSGRRVRMAAVGAVLVALLLAPAVWAFDTLSYATSGTFPSGGPASVANDGGGPSGAMAAFRGRRASSGGLGALPRLFGSAGPPAGTPPVGGIPSAAPRGAGPPPPGAFPGPSAGGGAIGSGARPGGLGGPFGGGDAALSEVVAYAARHGGGTIAVASQSSAAAVIVSLNASVAGIGGFSGRESDVSESWLAQEVRSGKIRWVLGEESGGGLSGRLPGDTRTGSKTAMAAVTRACRRVTLPASTTTAAARTGAGALYDCQGRAAALASAGARESSS